MRHRTPSSLSKLVGGSANPALAARVADELSVPLEPVETGTFADGETHVHIGGDLRHATVVVIQSTSPPVNDHLIELALLADAAQAAGAARVVGVVPYFGYSRQEQRAACGDPRSAQVVARLLEAAGIDHIVTLDLHAPALESALPMPATLLRPDELFLPILRGWGTTNLTIVAPDAGGMKRAQRIATALNAGLAVVTKSRPRPDETISHELLGDVRGRTCIILDDMASTGRTLTGAAGALHGAGARVVHAVFTHAVMESAALERLSAAPLEKLLTSDSVAVSGFPRLEVATIAPLLAQAIRNVVGDR